jgi:hypothetical protein
MTHLVAVVEKGIETFVKERPNVGRRESHKYLRVKA